MRLTFATAAAIAALLMATPSSAQQPPALTATATTPSPDSNELGELKAKLKEAEEKLAKFTREDTASVAFNNCFKLKVNVDSCMMQVAIDFHDTKAGAGAKDSILTDLDTYHDLKSVLERMKIGTDLQNFIPPSVTPPKGSPNWLPHGAMQGNPPSSSPFGLGPQPGTVEAGKMPDKVEKGTQDYFQPCGGCGNTGEPSIYIREMNVYGAPPARSLKPPSLPRGKASKKKKHDRCAC